MRSWPDRLLRRWEDRAAVRLEHHVEPGLRRRLDRLPGRLRDRRALRDERRARHHDVGEGIQRGRAQAWGWLGARTTTRHDPPRW